MICPYCQAEGHPSIVTKQAGSTTLLAWQTYFDETGTFHSHNPNRHTTGYRCSNKHAWTITYLAGCPNCDYGDGQQEITKLEGVE